MSVRIKLLFSLMLLCACQFQEVSPKTGILAQNNSFASDTPTQLTLNLLQPDGSVFNTGEVSIRAVFETASKSQVLNNEGQVVFSDLSQGIRYLILLKKGEQSARKWFTPLGDSSVSQTWVPVFKGPDSLADVRANTNSRNLRYFETQITPDFSQSLAVVQKDSYKPVEQLVDLNAEEDILWLLQNEGLPLFSERDIVQLKRFVSQGGILLLNGEWAGFYTKPSLNTVFDAFGFNISGTLAQPDSPLTLSNIHRHFLTSGVASLVLSRSGVVNVSHPESLELAFAPASSYRIQNEAIVQHTVMAVIPYEKGRVIALGDSSLWSNGLIEQGSNLTLWRNILSQPSLTQVSTGLERQ